MDLATLSLEHVRCEVDARGVGWLRIARPPANALNLPLVEELTLAVRCARFDPRVRLVAIASGVPGYFSSGLDVAELETGDRSRLELLDHLFKDLLVRPLRTARKLFVALVDGHCLGGGLELALAADLRLGVMGDWKLGLPEVRLGGFPGGGGVQLLARLVGQTAALRLVLRGELLDPAAAQALGLLDELMPAADAEAQVGDRLAELATGPLDAYAAIKLAVREGTELSPDSGMLLERELYRGLYGSADINEGLRAFREKRRPSFG